ncbi:MAG: glycosyltransferase family 2 protein [Anaerolineales bacterium]|nr:glycosyltransferase family 2 protein [Anaerolineales bacterium]
MPLVSVIIPSYNEQATIRLLLDAIYAQTFPRENLEVIIADGHSEDRTRDEIAAFLRDAPDLNVRVVDNDARNIPAAVNCGIRASHGDVIVRMDAHSRPYPDYIERCLQALKDVRGQNVGGVWEIHPGSDSWVARSIAIAAAHKLGVGNAGYRVSADASEVDTVPFGAFHRSLVDEIGYFDESLLSNEDYEFNARIRKSGGRIWLDPEIRTIYYSRATLAELAQQYWRYGYWKWHMLRRYPDTLRLRQALPPLFIISLAGFSVLAIFHKLFGFLGLIELAVYLCSLILVGIVAAVKERKVYILSGLPLAIMTMHLSWGSGFLWSLMTSLGAKRHG